jgi:hypothetical protein
MDAIQLVKRLPDLLQPDVHGRTIRTFHVARYPRRDDRVSTLERSSAEGLRRLAESTRALQRRIGGGLTSQQAMDLACSQETDRDVIELMTESLLKHRGNGHGDAVPVEQFDTRLDAALEEACLNGEYVALSSLCALSDGSTAHIPMMDLACLPSAHSLAWLIAGLRRLASYPWLLLNSGASYHVYGTRLLDEREWGDSLARWALFSPFVDTRYIGHARLDGACALRINGLAGGSPVPVLVTASEALL